MYSEASANAPGGDKKQVALPSSSVLLIKPNAANNAPMSSAIATPAKPFPSKPESALRLAYKSATDYKAVLAMVDALPGDPEALRIKAEIIQNCTKVTDDPNLTAFGDTAKWEKEWELIEAAGKQIAEKNKARNEKRDRRQEFINSLPAQHPDFAARVAAYDRIRPQKIEPEPAQAGVPCAALAQQKTSVAELNALWKAAEAAGDLVALSRSLECSFSHNPRMFASQDVQTKVAMIEDSSARRKMDPERLEKIRGLLARASPPNGLNAVLNLLTSSFPNGYFTIEDAAQAGADSALSKQLRELVPCDFGRDCTASRSRQIDEACAYKSQCAAGNYDDYLRFYVLSPVKAQELESHRNAFANMLRSGDFSKLRFVNRPTPSGDEEDLSSFYPNYTCTE